LAGGIAGQEPSLQDEVATRTRRPHYIDVATVNLLYR